MIAHNNIDLSGEQIGNYEIESLLTVRKASNFYLAQDVKLEHPVYLEILNTTIEEDADLAGRFHKRMETVSQIKHPNIATVIEVNTTADGYPYAVIDYFDSISLSQKEEEWHNTDALLSPIAALTYGRQIADALSIAHPAGLIHHDLRPQNILVRKSDGEIVLVDLGDPLVAVPPDAAMSNSRSEMLDYASPEEIEGKEISRRSNIYSLGIIIYELLTGHRPRLPASSWDIFERSTMPKEVPLEEERAGLSGETYRLVRNCLWRQEWSRFENAEELISAIDTAVLAEQALPKKDNIFSRNRRRWLYLVPVAAVLVILFGLLLVWGQFVNAGSNSPEETAVTTPQDPAAAAGAESGTVMPTETITREPLPTAESAVPIPVFGPPADSEYTLQDKISFSWVSLTLPKEGEQFAVYIIAEDEGSQQPILVGTVREPDNASLYLLEKQLQELPVTSGSYIWQVLLEAEGSSDPLTESDPRRFFVIANTPTLTATSTIEPTATATATATKTACVPTKPFGWIEHFVKAGETPSTFSQRANVPVQEIFEANCLEPNAILSIGQRLYIPPPLATNTPTPSPIQPTLPPTSGGGSGGGGGSNPNPTTPPKPPTSTPLPPP